MKNTVKMRFLATLLCAALLLSLLPVTVLAATEISSVVVTNLPTPAAGAQVPVSATVNTTGAQFYSMDWYDKTAGRFLESTDRFVEDHIYEVQLWIEAKSGYEFRTSGSSPSVSATVNGKTATVSKAYEYQAWAMVMVSYTFAPCGKNEIRSVDIQLDGISKQGNILRTEEGKNIPFSIQSGGELVHLYPQLHTRYYPYGFYWSNFTKDSAAYQGDRFQGGCDYFVTIALKPWSSEYVFADDFTATICGKSAQVKSLGKTYAEITVEVTSFGTIYAANVTPVVSLPRGGNAPDYGVYYGSSEHIDYAAVTGWYDVESGARLLSSQDQFQAGKQYRVELECTAAYGYVFQRDASGKMQYNPMITGVDVDNYSFGYDEYRGRETIKLEKTFTAAASNSQTTEPQHTHSPSDWRTTGAYHYKSCSTCGEFLEQEDHKGGVATCKEKGKCTVCGYAYLTENETHNPDTTQWTACGNLYHAHLCKDCGAHCDAQEHVAGPAGTPDTAVVCRDCGYILTPAKNHQHELTEVAKKDATCTEPGNVAYYTCSGCSELFADREAKTTITDTAVAPLGHTLSEAWMYDAGNHWRICTVCNQILIETQLAHDMTGEKCATCGYDGTLPDTEPTDTAPDPTQPQTPDQDDSGSPWWVFLLIGLVVVVAAAIGALTLKKKKAQK